jgi:hypothetical protein
MKRHRTFSIQALWVFACVAPFLVTASVAAVEESITGTVYANLWDGKDNVLGVVIEAHDGEYYNVSEDGRGKELFKLVDKNVKVTGVVEDMGGEKVITVVTYEVME